jgi:hypothetical protein
VAIVAIGIAFGAQWSGVILPGVAASGSLALTYVTITIARLLREQEQTAILTRTFGRYVSLQILDHILPTRARGNFGAERCDRTILFCRYSRLHLDLRSLLAGTGR